MSVKLIFPLMFSVTSLFVHGQGTVTITTDRSSYDYGETIEVQLNLANHTDSSFTIVGSSSCIAGINPKGVHFGVVCTADEHQFDFPPGSSRTWIWHLNPSALGYPDTSGQQTIYGRIAGYFDSVQFEAPQYYGGIISLSYHLSVPQSSIQSLRDSIGATVLHSDTLSFNESVTEEWSISGHSIDSIVEEYSNDSRLRYIEAERWLAPDQVIITSIPNISKVPNQYFVSQNYPNPFNPVTNISFVIPKSQHVQILLYDMVGRMVSIIVDKYFQAGTHTIAFNAAILASGTYFYLFRTQNYQQIKKLLILK